MTKGYQVIYPDELAELKDDILCVAVLHWLVDRLKIEHGVLLSGIEISVIKVNYHGNYPAIGLHYGEQRDNREAEILAAISALLKAATVIDLIKFFTSVHETWEDVASSLLQL